MIFQRTKKNGHQRLELNCSNVTNQILYCLLGVTLILGIPTYIFCEIEGWSIVDSIYFSLISLSTVGFGVVKNIFKNFPYWTF